MVRHQLSLATLDTSHLRLQLLDLIDLPLATVLGGHLVLPPPPDVPTERELLLRQLVLGQQVIELVHGEVDDVGTGDGEPQLLRLIISGIRNDSDLPTLILCCYLSLISGKCLASRQAVLFLPLLPPVRHVDVGVDKLGVSVVRVVRPQRLVLHSVRIVSEGGGVLEQLVARQIRGRLTQRVGGQRLRCPGGGVGLVPFSDDFLLPVRVSSSEDYGKINYRRTRVRRE